MAIGGTLVLTLIFLRGQRKGNLRVILLSLSVPQDYPVLPVLYGIFLRCRVRDRQKFAGQNPETICRELCNREEDSPKSLSCLHTNVFCW